MPKLVIKSFPELSKGRKRNRKPNYCYEKIIPSDFLLEKLSGKRYFFRTYGCQANVHDEETLSGILDICGMTKTKIVDEADLIIILTCCIRENAEEKVYSEIGNLKKLKEKNKNLIICVGGCMVEQPHIVNKIIDVYHQIDIIFGTHNIQNLLELLEEKIKNNERIVDVKSDSGDVFELSTEAHRLEAKKAYVNIIYGCNKFCTYCIVPYVRGQERSRKKEDIINEVNCLIKKGYIDITLLGQNVNSYGKDLYNDYDFGNLLEDCAKTGVKRLRFMTSHPADFTFKMVDVIAKYENIMKFIHLPVQSGNDEILKKMNRHYDTAKYLALVDCIKEKIPNASFSTDIIVGFPNETYEQFSDTVKLCERVKYDNIYTFIYSPRVGTPAALITDNVAKEEKSKRFDELLKVSDSIVEELSEKMVGKTYEVLVDSVSKKNPNLMTGYNENNKLINFPGDASLIGKLVKVKIIESHIYSLIGEIVQDE